jgi:hypothetical protein
MPRSLAIEGVRPTYQPLSAEKLGDVLAWFDPESPDYDSLPPFGYDGDSSLVDGHTRAHVAWLCCADTLRVERDQSTHSVSDFERYRTCIQ